MLLSNDKKSVLEVAVKDTSPNRRPESSEIRWHWNYSVKIRCYLFRKRSGAGFDCRSYQLAVISVRVGRRFFVRSPQKRILLEDDEAFAYSVFFPTAFWASFLSSLGFLRIWGLGGIVFPGALWSKSHVSESFLPLNIKQHISCPDVSVREITVLRHLCGLTPVGFAFRQSDERRHLLFIEFGQLRYRVFFLS